MTLELGQQVLLMGRYLIVFTCPECHLEPEVCGKMGWACVDCPHRQYDGDDALGVVISLNLARGLLSDSPRASVAARLAKTRCEDNLRQNTEPPSGGSVVVPTEKAGQMPSVPSRSVERARAVHDTVSKSWRASHSPKVSALIAQFPLLLWLTHSNDAFAVQLLLCAQAGLSGE